MHLMPLHTFCNTNCHALERKKKRSTECIFPPFIQLVNEILHNNFCFVVVAGKKSFNVFCCIYTVCI